MAALVLDLRPSLLRRWVRFCTSRGSECASWKPVPCSNCAKDSNGSRRNRICTCFEERERDWNWDWNSALLLLYPVVSAQYPSNLSIRDLVPWEELCPQVSPWQCALQCPGRSNNPGQSPGTTTTFVESIQQHSPARL